MFLSVPSLYNLRLTAKPKNASFISVLITQVSFQGTYYKHIGAAVLRTVLTLLAWSFVDSSLSLKLGE